MAAFQRFSGRHDGRRGASLIEFAISVLVMFFVVFWTWELVMAVYTYAVLSNAAKEGIRYAIVHGTDTGAANCSGPGSGGVTCTDSTGANVASVVRDYASYSFHNVSAMAVNVTYPDSSSDPQSLVKITVSYDYIPWTVLPWTTPRLKTGAQGRIVW